MEANEDKCFVDLSTMLVIIGIAQTQNNNCKKLLGVIHLVCKQIFPKN